jgi:hypothetical protein
MDVSGQLQAPAALPPVHCFNWILETCSAIKYFIVMRLYKHLYKVNESIAPWRLLQLIPLSVYENYALFPALWQLFFDRYSLLCFIIFESAVSRVSRCVMDSGSPISGRKGSSSQGYHVPTRSGTYSPLSLAGIWGSVPEISRWNVKRLQ